MRAVVMTSMLALALGLGACAKKKNVADLPPPVASAATVESSEGANDDQIASGPAPGSQADLAAKAGSDRVFFEYDSHDLSDEARATLQRHAEWLRQNPTVSFTIEGHADERGTREYNLALGDRRANAVKNYLAALGIPANRLRTISYGKERPEVQGSDEAAHAQNRRAVSVVAGGPTS
jgi:peptidoglycan-associated lipoprotein